MTPRIRRLPHGEWPADMGDALAAMVPPVQRHPRPPTEDRPRGKDVVGTLAHHPELARAFFTFNGHLLWATSLTPRQREIIVMRIAVRRQAGYVWAMHLFEARDSGLTEEEIGRIAFGPDAPFWTPLDQAIIRAVDELVDDGGITEATWAVLAEELDEQQLLDLIFTVGCLRDHLVAGQLGRVRGRSRGPRDVRALPAATGRSPVKPAPFAYHAPSSLDEAVGLLAELGDGAKVLGGGQSLVAMLNLRLAVFDHLVDLRRVDELRGIERRNGSVWIGGGTTQATIEASPVVAEGVPLLVRATALIGHFQIRNRGTIGGSLAHADPAAEYPAVALALDAELEAQSPRGRRTIPAGEFFVGLWTSALAEDEVLTGVTFPVWTGRTGCAVEELARRHGDFAIAGAVVAVRARRGRSRPPQCHRPPRHGLDARAGVGGRVRRHRCRRRRRRCRRGRAGGGVGPRRGSVRPARFVGLPDPGRRGDGGPSLDPCRRGGSSCMTPRSRSG